MAMKRFNWKMKKIILMFLCFQSLCAEATLPDCGKAAAIEFDVPEKIFSAMALEEVNSPKDSNREHYGPMGLSRLIVPVAAKGINSTESKVKTDICENYRAAAWLLTKPIRDGKTTDIWIAVNHDYYGAPARSSYPLADRVKSRISSL
jgi:hypothetical protein